MRGRRFIVLKHHYGRRDVMWKPSISSSNKIKKKKIKELAVISRFLELIPLSLLDIRKKVEEIPERRKTLYLVLRVSK